VLLCLVSEKSGRRATGTLASRRKREAIGTDGLVKSPGQASKKPFALGTSKTGESKKAKFERVFVQSSRNDLVNVVLLPKSRSLGRSQWVDATLSSNPTGIENKRQNRLLGLDQPERCPGWILPEYSQIDGSPAQASSSQLTGWCCIDRLSWHASPDIFAARTSLRREWRQELAIKTSLRVVPKPSSCLNGCI
jgi:hypothetical protein